MIPSYHIYTQFLLVEFDKCPIHYINCPLSALQNQRNKKKKTYEKILFDQSIHSVASQLMLLQEQIE